MISEAKTENNKVIILIAFLLLGVATVAIAATVYMAIATLAYSLLVIGLSYRRIDTKIHARLMSAGMFTDLSLVLVLEVLRNAIDTATSFTMTPLQQMHILTSSLAVLFYFPVLLLGVIRLKSNEKTLKSYVWHKRLGIVAFCFRTLGFIFMFSLL